MPPKTRSQLKEQTKARMEKETSPFNITGRGTNTAKTRELPRMIIDKPAPVVDQGTAPEPDRTKPRSPDEAPPQFPTVARKPRKIRWDDDTDINPIMYLNYRCPKR
ncbi:hypothetical protein B0H14DRAFT_2617304 [Mycena olivaceomarginata]|nr:hypothetical protein B0H14DRAFT_2617304 [Mycena olivaceomarginata]